MSLSNNLKDKGYNLRERANIYAGMTLGAIAPIVGLRYSLLDFSESGAQGELISWTSA